MASDLDSNVSIPGQTQQRESAGWLKVGAVAAASALAGGLAAAWYYRKTLARLQQAEAQPVALDTEENSDDTYYDIS
jgi:hypothetical protein